jgi:hypothetical protein
VQSTTVVPEGPSPVLQLDSEHKCNAVGNQCKNNLVELTHKHWLSCKAFPGQASNNFLDRFIEIAQPMKLV